MAGPCRVSAWPWSSAFGRPGLGRLRITRSEVSPSGRRIASRPANLDLRQDHAVVAEDLDALDVRHSRHQFV